MDALCNRQDPLTIKAFQYDLVCNGYEIASGSIRNQSPETMVKAFEMTWVFQRPMWKSASAAFTARSSMARRRTAAWRQASTAW